LAGVQAGTATGTSIGGGANALLNTTPNLNLPTVDQYGGLTLSIFDSLASKVLTLELAASEQDNTTKNIGSPRVVTSDKMSATIEQGTEIPYLQASSSGAANIAFKKAVLGLTVTPQITPDDHVLMKLNVSQDKVGTVYFNVPSIETKKIDTEVLVENGGTVVIGGVYKEESLDKTNQVPLFGDIPILGWLFKNNTMIKSKTELLIFITPKILKESMGMN